MEKIMVSAIIVVRNEEEYIQKSLSSLLNQDYPKENYELLLVDGMSTDRTREIIEETIKEKKETLQIRIFENPKKNLASGWNMAIKEAVGEYVIRIDAHAEARPDFIRKSVETMQKVGDAVCVGGRLTTQSIDEKGETISKVLSSPFGIGNSKFRYSNTAQYVDTVAFGLYKKEIFTQVGYFDESLQRNQDNNMHARIRQAGGKFYFNPEIECTYYSRNKVKKMMKQGFLNGKWNMVVLKQNKSSLSLRHVIPLMFVLSLILLGLLGIIHPIFWYGLVLELVMYFVCAVIAGICKTRNPLEVLKMMGLFFLLHISYGSGSLTSIHRLLKKE